MVVNGRELVATKYGDLPIGATFKDHPKSVITYQKLKDSAQIVGPGRTKTVYMGHHVTVYIIKGNRYEQDYQD